MELLKRTNHGQAAVEILNNPQTGAIPVLKQDEQRTVKVDFHTSISLAFDFAKLFQVPSVVYRPIRCTCLSESRDLFNSVILSHRVSKHAILFSWISLHGVAKQTTGGVSCAGCHLMFALPGFMMQRHVVPPQTCLSLCPHLFEAFARIRSFPMRYIPLFSQ